MQADGALVETGSTSGNGFNNAIVRREAADLSPDFVFESKGRLTDYGYEVEVRVPFKSLRFQPSKEQRWGINVTRRVQHSGQEDSWAPAKRASASFLAQSGHLVGLTDLQRGLVLDLNPSLTSRTTGAAAPTGWDYTGGGPELGGSVRVGNHQQPQLQRHRQPRFLPGRVGCGAVPVRSPRDELFFPEKRPFFLDGSEQFNTPNQLIYTRRIVQPVAAVKLTGKGFGTDIGFLSAVDDQAASAYRRPPRLQPAAAAAGHRGQLAARAGLHRPDRRRRLRTGSAVRTARLVFGGRLQRAVPGRGEPHDARAAVTTTAPLCFGRFIAQRPHLRPPRHLQRIGSGLPRPQRLLPPARTSRTSTSSRG